MSNLSKVALALAFSVTACSERSPVGPQSASGFTATAMPLPAPTALRAAFVGADGDVFISWTQDYLPHSTTGVSGFLVERALDPGGPWSIHRFTRDHTSDDTLGADQSYCYRVTALASSSSTLNSPPSRALCIEGSNSSSR